jgi:hypothetical protein
MKHHLLTEKNIALLHEWELSNLPHSMHQKNNGCEIVGEMVTPFLKDLIEELEEEYNSNYNFKPELSTEELLEKNGYTILTQSPYELEKNNEVITGQCALWLISHLRQEYRNQNDASTPIDILTLQTGDVVYRVIHNEASEGWEATSYSKDTVKTLKVGVDFVNSIVDFENSNSAYGHFVCFRTKEELFKHIELTDLQ